MKNIHDEVSRCIIQMLLKEPFFAHLLSGIVRNISKEIPTAAVGLRGSNINLFVNENFFLKELTTASSRVAVIKHETLHLMFKHIFRMDIHKHDPLLFNYAADIVVNQFIGSWDLPDSAVTLATFPDLDLEADQSVDWYYKKLAGLANEMRKKSKGFKFQKGESGSGEASSQAQKAADSITDKTSLDDAMSAAEKSVSAAEKCAESSIPGNSTDSSNLENAKSAAQDAIDKTREKLENAKSEMDPKDYKDAKKKLDDLEKKVNKLQASGQPRSQPSSDWSNTSAPQSAGNLEKMYGTPSHSDHSTWGVQKDASGLESSAQAGSAESALDRMIVQARDRTPIKDRGTIPGRINDMINAIIEKRKPKVDWRRALRIFATSSRRTRVVHTMKRVSKRYGTRPGIKIKRFQKMAVAIDTSGSVSDDQLSIFFSEVHGMWRNGAEVEIIECDAAVQRHYSYHGKVPEFVAGRGGTVFDPVFKFLRENRQMQFDGCIYLTDGYASEPEIRPPCKLIWIITPDGDAGDHLKYGRVIKLPE